MINKICSLLLCSAVLGVGTAEAAYVNVTNATNNGTLATALNLDAKFDKMFDANIGDFTNKNISTSFFHVSANAVTTGGSGDIRNYQNFDWYSFNTYQSKVQAFFDIDLTTNLNSFIKLYDGRGSEIASNNDHSPRDNGSPINSSNDSYIKTVLQTPGLYYLSVGRALRQGTKEIQAPMIPGQSYTLHISLANHTPSAVPVPAAVWLFGSGMVGMIGLSRKIKAAV